MTDLINQIRAAQIRAGEDAVIAHLRAQGLAGETNTEPPPARNIAQAGSMLQMACHGASASAGWWGGFSPDCVDMRVDVVQARSNTPFGRALVGTKLMLIVSEVAEAMEGHRKSLQDDKLPHRPMVEVELADAVIRIADLAGALGLDLGGAIAEKLAFNAVRPDHKPEARAAAGGKAY